MVYSDYSFSVVQRKSIRKRRRKRKTQRCMGCGDDRILSTSVQDDGRIVITHPNGRCVSRQGGRWANEKPPIHWSETVIASRGEIGRRDAK